MIAWSGSASATLKYCGRTYGGDVIEVHRVSCHRSRRIVRAWAHGFKRDGRATRQVRGFKCVGRNNPYEGLVVFCHRHLRRIIFYANVP